MKADSPLIADFGVSAVLESDDELFHQTEGTTHCLAPEICDPNVNGYDGRAADVWALGVLCFCMVTGKLPFHGQTEYFVMENIRTQLLVIPENVSK